MWLTTQQINTIFTTSSTIVGVDTLVWLYGSRLDDTRHGGDILVKNPCSEENPFVSMALAQTKLLELT